MSGDKMAKKEKVEKKVTKKQPEKKVRLFN